MTSFEFDVSVFFTNIQYSLHVLLARNVDDTDVTVRKEL